MKKIFLVFLATILITKLSISQDIITLKSGDQIRSKIIEIGQTDVKYKKFDNQGGPVYVEPKTDIVKIVYENGTKDTFNNEQAKPDTLTLNQTTANTVNKGDLKPTPAKPKGSRFMIGFSGIYPTGTWPATALTNMGSTSFLKGQGSPVKSYGLGIIIQGKITDNISLFFDINAYDYNIMLAKQGADVTTAWTTSEGALHWDEAGAPQILYVHNLATDVHFDMQTTGMRLGGKYIFGKKNIRPWGGAAFGFYKWTANYFNGDKSETYGKDEGYTTGLTFLFGIDFEVMPGMVITPFADLASPAINYKIGGLFYPQWDIDYQSPIMGTSRFGLTLSFDPGSHAKKSK
jgi:hypothetical protein